MIVREWVAIPQDIFKNLILSMSKRIGNVILRRGKHLNNQIFGNLHVLLFNSYIFLSLNFKFKNLKMSVIFFHMLKLTFGFP